MDACTRRDTWHAFFAPSRHDSGLQQTHMGSSIRVGNAFARTTAANLHLNDENADFPGLSALDFSCMGQQPAMAEQVVANFSRICLPCAGCAPGASAWQGARCTPRTRPPRPGMPGSFPKCLSSMMAALLGRPPGTWRPWPQLHAWHLRTCSVTVLSARCRATRQRAPAAACRSCPRLPVQVRHPPSAFGSGAPCIVRRIRGGKSVKVLVLFCPPVAPDRIQPRQSFSISRMSILFGRPASSLAIFCKFPYSSHITSPRAGAFPDGFTQVADPIKMNDQRAPVMKF